jgi:hypothetical protein
MEESNGFLYGVVLVYKTTVEGGYEPPRFSEDLVVLRADSESMARQTGLKIGQVEESSHSNVFGEDVTWHFLGVADVRLLQTDELEYGVPLMSRSFDNLARYSELFSITSLKA